MSDDVLACAYCAATPDRDHAPTCTTRGFVVGQCTFIGNVIATPSGGWRPLLPSDLFGRDVPTTIPPQMLGGTS